MSRQKKTFPCGHKGYGKICHHCDQKQQLIEYKRQEKDHWQSTFATDPIDLRHLPKNVVVKARHILQGLANHQDYRDFHGKRLRHNRSVISIPVTRHYRLLCRDQGLQVIPEEVISHEDYNVCKPGR